GLFENFIIIELEKLRKINTIHQTMYFYREYGGKEIDVVLEDYKKNYICLELKLDKNNGNKDIFPLTHKFITINKNDYFEKLSNLTNL
ncbi:DUF4143 domain-containing protein, partial [Patescibacteria group bacterium]|nr:DUF4143 domain-containing protein [Patescibacteria group bacterium]